MESPTLGHIFTKHLGFPARRGAAVATERFADRLADRASALVPERNDPEAWVSHFFEVEQPIEEHQRALEAFGASDENGSVLQFDLGEHEFVVIDDGDELVVVSDRGSIVLASSPSVRARLSSAELPSSSRTSPSAPFKGSGDRAYFVSSSGKVAQLDARVVAKVVASTPAARVETVARVAAPQRLAPFSIVERRVEVKATEAARTVKSVARADLQGSAAPQVVVVERSNAKQVSGESARFWQRLATSLTAGGRRGENLGRTIPGASAVAIGRQTFAVKAGGVTALVQRPVQGIGTRGEAMAARAQASLRRSSASPRWVRDVLDERPRGKGFWIQPAIAERTVGVAKPSWVEHALSHARELRSRARDEVRSAPLAPAARLPSASATALAPAPRFAAEWPSFDFTLPELRVRRASIDVDGGDPPRPLTVADVMPATTLRALYTGLERSAAAEGHRITSIDVEALPSLPLDTAPTGTTGTTEAFVNARFEVPQVRAIEVHTASQLVSPEYLDAPFAQAGTVRVGGDLDHAIERAVLRPISTTPTVAFAASPAAPRAAALATAPRAPEAGAKAPSISYEPVAEPVRLRVMVPSISGVTATTMPAAVSGLMGAGSASVRLSALNWLDWAVSNAPFALAKQRGEKTLDHAADASAPALELELPSPKHDVELVATPVDDAHDAASAHRGDTVRPHASHGLAIAHEPAVADAAPRFGVAARAPAIGPRAELVATPVLAAVNRTRLPAAHGFDHVEAGEAASGVERVEIGVPLHVQMTEARSARAAPEHGLAEHAPTELAIVPVVSGTYAVEAGGRLQAGASRSSAGAPSVAAGALPSPSGSFQAGVAPASARSSHAGLPGTTLRPGIESLSGYALDDVRVHHASARPSASSATADTHGEHVVVAPGQDRPLPHEAAHVVQQAGGARPSASRGPSSSVAASGVGGPASYESAASIASSPKVRTKRRGEGVLRFRYPAEPRWWGLGATSSVAAAGTSGAVGTLTVPSAATPEHVSASMPASAVQAHGSTLPTIGAAASHGVAPARTPSMSSPSAYGARGARSNGLSGGLPSAPPAASPAPAPQGAPSDSEMAYVAVGPTGEARVLGAKGAAAIAQKRRGGSSVDMTIVAGIAPKAPGMEEMALAGHERPHAKGKNEGSAQGGAAGKTDALSLQGTVDSLAQRIYHRLKRRLASDRERFGG